jgi:hypothetical protein
LLSFEFYHCCLALVRVLLYFVFCHRCSPCSISVQRFLFSLFLFEFFFLVYFLFSFFSFLLVFYFLFDGMLFWLHLELILMGNDKLMIIIKYDYPFNCVSFHFWVFIYLVGIYVYFLRCYLVLTIAAIPPPL